MAYVEVTRAQFRALLNERLGAAATTFWRDDEKNKVIQESLRFFNLLTGFWKTRTTLTTVANQVWYALPSAITSQMRVVWQSQPLSPASAYDMDFGRPTWESETTASGGDVPTVPKLFVIGGLNLIALWPADASGNSAMVVDGIAATPLLSTDATKLDVGQEEMDMLLDYCQHVCTFKEAGKEFADSASLLKNFLSKCAERSAILKSSATFKRYMGLDRARWQKKTEIAMAEQGAR